MNKNVSYSVSVGLILTHLTFSWHRSGLANTDIFLACDFKLAVDKRWLVSARNIDLGFSSLLDGRWIIRSTSTISTLPRHSSWFLRFLVSFNDEHGDRSKECCQQENDDKDTYRKHDFEHLSTLAIVSLSCLF